MNVYCENDAIYFSAEGLNKLGYTEFIPELLEIISRTTWTVQNDKDGNPKTGYEKQYRIDMNKFEQAWYVLIFLLTSHYVY